MKHQVFLFLSLYSFSINAMHPDTSIITKDWLVSGLTYYSNFMEKNCPHRIPVQALRSDIERIKAADLSDTDIKKIRKEMSLLPSSMPDDIHKITKSQLINELTKVNYHIKTYYHDDFDVKKFGRFIIALKNAGEDFFERHKTKILASMEILPSDSFDLKEFEQLMTALIGEDQDYSKNHDTDILSLMDIVPDFPYEIELIF
jgi:hypothetical protein